SIDGLTPAQRDAARAKYPDLIARLEAGEHVALPPGKASKDMLASITAATGNEVALVRIKGQGRFLVLGKGGEVDIPANAKVIAHTHPHGELRFSDEDVEALHERHQTSSVLIAPDGAAERPRVPAPHEADPSAWNPSDKG